MINPIELIFCVDEHNNPIEPQTKVDAHAKGIWHRNSHVWVTDGSRILCHKRSLQVPSNQGKWEAPFAGHSKSGETPLQTALTELAEESGITLLPHNLTFHFTHIYNSERNKEFISVYSAVWNKSIKSLKIEIDEVTEVGWYTYDELANTYRSSSTSWVCVGYETHLLTRLKDLRPEQVRC